MTNSGVILAGAGGDATYATSSAGGIGVDLANGGMLTNSGTIMGGTGVYIDGATVVSSGTIVGGAGGFGSYGSGAAGDAVQFGSVAGTVEIDPGAVFDGAIAGNAAIADTLVLAGHAAGTLSGLGTTATGLNEIVVDAHAHWLLEGSVSGAGSLLLDAGARLAIYGGEALPRSCLARAGRICAWTRRGRSAVCSRVSARAM